MKKILFPILLLSIALTAVLSCGDDELEPKTNTPQQPQQPKHDAPYIDESSITCDVANMIITFKGVPNDGSIRILFAQRTNGTGELWMNVSRDNAKQLYYVSLSKLTGGSEYAFYVVAYDYYGVESFRSAERTFTLPKNGPPAAPSLAGIQVFAPTSYVAADGYAEGGCITTAMEYGVDDGETWTPVAVAGSIRDLRPGKVQVRLKETATAEASRTAFFIIPKYQSNTDLDGEDGTSPGLRSPRK
ncbi:MAG: hypothetical protein IJQ59_10705 [Bacteroidaceae bacterium]|nr:hypothetical protein [Bacteroidaceae bacterium]